MDITILFENDDFLVVNKPAGLIVNRSDTTKNEQTLQDILKRRYSTLYQGSTVENGDFFTRSGIVHRLDKETSGILLAAKTKEVFENLQRQFKERNVKKTYVGLVHGDMMQSEGEIRLPVGRLPWNRKRFGVIAGGKDAVTRYSVIKKYTLETQPASKLTLLYLYPETGRTHQLRVHLSYVHHPIFSDNIYAGRKTSRQDRTLLPRVFLHASHIEFSHPKLSERVAYEAPLPPELESFLKTIG